MSLDEAIKHCEEVASANERLCETVHPAMQLSDYGKCAAEHRQLAEWLKDYKRLKEQEPILDKIRTEIEALPIAFTSSFEMKQDCLDILDKYKGESERT